MGSIEFMRDNAAALADAYANKKDFPNAYKYHIQYINYRDSMVNTEVGNRAAVLQYSNDLEKKQAQIVQLNQQKKIQKGFLSSVVIVLGLILLTAVLLLRNNRQKQKANKLLRKQKQEIDAKAKDLEQSYNNMELLGDIGRKVTSSLSVETIISTVYDSVNSLMDASVFGIGIYHEDTKQIDFPATYENGVALPAYSNSIYEENRFASLCFISGKEIVMGDVETEHKSYLQHMPAPKQGQHAVSLIYLPLKAKERMFGVITVQSFQRNAYSDYHLYMLRTIALYAAIALENAESYKKLNQTVDSLTRTQSQLIQSEKMASLGELTAGIAHEIQNPLNFVNNFAEVNVELIEELGDLMETGDLQAVNETFEDIKINLEKIRLHGRRADSIVKGMLQHSQSSTGAKETIDINALTDEYLRLAYHGLRAKDKSFNAITKTEFDHRIDKINVVPQEIGRVLLNLINNAYYTVHEKKKVIQNGYEPTVTVSTVKDNGQVKIKVRDNGNGIPPKILDKIFQPFFTTKPTGQGTGLGLSLAYDIVKAHGGEIKVETRENEGTEFTMVLAA
jgi:C4-dicarboxylate-specific signal transduction histidine kinase